MSEANKLLYKELSYQVQGGIFEVYKALGCSFKESAYDNALFEELTSERKLLVERQKRIGIYFKGKKVGIYVPDQVIEHKIIHENRSATLDTETGTLWYSENGGVEKAL